MDESVAILNARIACANLRCAGMQAENKDRENRGLAVAYVENDFVNVIIEEGIDWNAVCKLLYGR